jgi:hypothetical protein
MTSLLFCGGGLPSVVRDPRVSSCVPVELAVCLATSTVSIEVSGSALWNVICGEGGGIRVMAVVGETWRQSRYYVSGSTLCNVICWECGSDSRAMADRWGNTCDTIKKVQCWTKCLYKTIIAGEGENTSTPHTGPTQGAPLATSGPSCFATSGPSCFAAWRYGCREPVEPTSTFTATP